MQSLAEQSHVRSKLKHHVVFTYAPVKDERELNDVVINHLFSPLLKFLLLLPETLQLCSSINVAILNFFYQFKFSANTLVSVNLFDFIYFCNQLL